MSSTSASLVTTTPFNRAAWLATKATSSPPPPGVTPVFDGPNPNGVLMIIVNIVGVILCTTITAMRLWTKGVLMRTAGWDDYSCVITFIGIFIWTIAQVKSSLLGWGRPDYNIRVTNATFQLHGKLEFMAQDCYLFSIGCVKISILLMYLRAFNWGKPIKYSIYLLIFLIFGAHTTIMLAYTFSNLPTTCHWTFYPTSAEYYTHCHHSKIAFLLNPYSLFINVFTVFVDIIIIYLPCRPVWQLQLPKRQRISILMILFAGVIVTVASLLRLGYFVARFYGGKVDQSLTEFRVNLITTIELDVAHLCCCLPILKPFMRQYMPGFLRLNRLTTRSKDRSSVHPAASSSQHPIKTGRKWPSGSRDEELIGSSYLKLGEDGKNESRDEELVGSNYKAGEDSKSDQSYVMSTIPVKDGK